MSTNAASPPDAESIEVSVVMPCLNEARTLPACIGKARAALEKLGTTWEIVIADNGSTDGSQALATSLGARVVPVAKRGYGNAYIGGVDGSRGRYIVMGDSDDSYDFGELGPFVEKLRGGCDIVMGSRFRGTILPGAMPWSHRYVGNPVLTGILNLLFRAGVSDAHCGLRALTRSAWQKMRLRTGGMEFASEMVIRAASERLKMGEIPITLHKDGRDRPPHLRSFRDGWRHLRFMLMFSPLWLFLIPGAILSLVGCALLAVIPFRDVTILGHELSVHFSILGSTLALVGFQLLQFGTFTKMLFVSEGLGEDRLGRWASERFNLNRGLLAGVVLALAGAAGDAQILAGWLAEHGGGLSTQVTERAILFSTMLLFGVQLIFSVFFLGILRSARTGRWAD